MITHRRPFPSFSTPPPPSFSRIYSSSARSISLTTRTRCWLLAVSPQIAPISFGDEPVNAGDLVSVQCVVTKGDSPLEIAWTFDNQPIRSDRMDVIVSNSGKRVKQLTIESVAARHAGEYTCVASNAAGSTSHSAKLDVNGTQRPDILLVARSPFLLLSPSFAFHLPLSPFSRLAKIRKGGEGRERFSRSILDPGVCKADALFSSSFSSFLFPVIPKLLPFTFGEKPLNSGQVVTVPCAVVEGDQPLKLRWTLNGHSISPHSGISIVDLGGRGAILSIGSVQATHAGTYTCIAENLAGRHELSADLIVNGA